MAGTKRASAPIVVELGNQAIGRISRMEKHWRGLTPTQREKVIAPIEQAVSRLRDLNNDKPSINLGDILDGDE